MRKMRVVKPCQHQKAELEETKLGSSENQGVTNTEKADVKELNYCLTEQCRIKKKK